MKKPETSFTDQFGKTVTFINLNVYQWEITIERDPITLKRKKEARVVLHVKYDSIRKESPLQISKPQPKLGEFIREDSDESNGEGSDNT